MDHRRQTKCIFHKADSGGMGHMYLGFDMGRDFRWMGGTFLGGRLPVDDVYRQPEAGASWKMGNGRERKMSTEIAIALKLYKYESNMQHNNGVRPKRTRRYDNSTI